MIPFLDGEHWSTWRRWIDSFSLHCGQIPTLAVLTLVGWQSVTAQAKQPIYEIDIQPLFNAKCADCHGSQVRTNGLNLATLEGVLRGGESGPVVTPGNPDESRLYQLVKEGTMPMGKPRLPVEDVALIRAWIEAGAPSQISDLYERKIQPIFTANCLLCHNSERRTRSLDLSTSTGVLNGSESGPVVIPGRPEESRLYQFVRDGVMPQGKPRLSNEDVAAIHDWIERGAPTESGLSLVDMVSQHDVIPILLLRCTVCHGLRRQEAGLDLRGKEAMLRGGKSGPAIVPGKPADSLLIQKIKSGEMPPVKMMLEVSVRPITNAETELIANWIAQGAPEVPPEPDLAGTSEDPLVTDEDRNFWAFQAPQPVAIPAINNSGQVRNPIDAFILEKLAEKELVPSPEASRLTLIRRAYFDLTGLPPTPQEVKEFLADRDPGAYEKLIDRLLASPRYGERWGRYWLDAVGYADSEGKLNSDPIRPTTFRYRDYVIRSLNADKPYNRFLLEQIAGDELQDWENAPVITQEIIDNLVATGFLRMAADATNQRDMNFVDDRLDVIADELQVLGSTVMALTIQCARCHSHKYDPIPQRDYYRLIDIFKGAFDEHDWLPPLDKYNNKEVQARVLPHGTPGSTPMQVLLEERQRVARNNEIQEQIDSLKEALKERGDQLRDELIERRMLELPPEVREDMRVVLATAPEKHTPAQKALAKKFEKQLKISSAELKLADPEFRAFSENTDRQISILEAQQPLEPTIRALWDRGSLSPTYILRRGSPSDFGPVVSPGPPAVLQDVNTRFVTTPPWPGAKTSGRRLAFARWLTRPGHPLTARVIVNRLWSHHFGQGIVGSLGDFGHTGTPPTHPELLDWLGHEFVRNGWSMKHMHRLMMTSSTYRQSSERTRAHEKIDPENKLLSHMPMRRMEAEVLYDTMLMVSGRLDETPFGFPSPVLSRADGSVTPIAMSDKGWRRAIYTLQRRKQIPTALTSFDFPQLTPNCLQRSESNVALQALFLMNDSMVRQLSHSFAKRIETEAGTDPGKQVERIYRIALSRPATKEEKQLTLKVLSDLRKVMQPVGGDSASTEALVKVCHSIFNTAAFMYID